MARKPRAEFEITAEDRSRAVLDQLAGSMTTIQRIARRAGFALGALVGGLTIADMVQLTDRTNQLSARIRTDLLGDFRFTEEQMVRILRETDHLLFRESTLLHDFLRRKPSSQLFNGPKIA